MIGARMPRSTRVPLRRFLVHHGFGARRIDDALGEAVHLLDLDLRTIGRPRALERRDLLGHQAAPHLGGESVEPVIGLGDVAAECGEAVADQHDEVGILDEAGDGADIGLDIDMRRHEVHRLSQHEGRIERPDLEFVRRARPGSAMVASSWTWMVAPMSGRSRRISRLRLWPTLVMRSPQTMRLVGMSVMTMFPPPSPRARSRRAWCRRARADKSGCGTRITMLPSVLWT